MATLTVSEDYYATIRRPLRKLNELLSDMDAHGADDYLKNLTKRVVKLSKAMVSR